jgi:triosephosphate isomerase (TIM)
MSHLVLINFKTYKETIADKALEVARKIAKVKNNKYTVGIAPSLLTIKEIAQKTDLSVFSQHTDHVELGSNTGRIPADELKKIGVKGTILNHSERKIPSKYLKNIIEKCRAKRLKTIVCASGISEMKKVLQFNPDYLAYEPKEFIGGNISVTEAKPDVILRAAEVIKEINPRTKLLCGAGIHSKEDLGHALLLGADGVLIGHAVSKAKDPKKFLEEMLL